MTEKYGQIFTEELELCKEDGIIGGELHSGLACLLPRFHLLNVLYRGDLQLVRGLILLRFFHHGNQRGSCRGI